MPYKHDDIEECHDCHLIGDVTENELIDLAELFKIFGDSTRIKILFALFESELCVGDLARLLGLSQSAVSHQLKTLKEAKLQRQSTRKKRRGNDKRQTRAA